MNVRDSEGISGALAAMGYDLAADEKEADVAVLNTCCVRGNAENKVFGHIGWLKNVGETKGRPYTVVVCGCMAQRKDAVERIKRSCGHVGVVFGTFNAHRLPEYLWRHFETNRQVVEIWDSHGEALAEGCAAPVREKKFKASVNVMYGCDNFCSYCVVPYVRGRERSRPPGDIMKEVETFAADGAKEILLLGQNVNSYGAGLDGGVDFAGLLEMINGIDGIERVRFMTSHPKDISGRLISAIGRLDKVCAHIHLPAQSGSDRILALMNRKYTKDHYLSLVARLRETVPGIAVTTDLIVGFPDEAEEDFEETLDLVSRARFNGAFTFNYSAREGTPAASMEGRVPDNVVRERFDRLLGEVNGITAEINKGYEGKTLRVLAESRATNGVVTGRAESNAIVHFKGDGELVGEFVDVRVIEGRTFYLRGEQDRGALPHTPARDFVP